MAACGSGPVLPTSSVKGCKWLDIEFVHSYMQSGSPLCTGPSMQSCVISLTLALLGPTYKGSSRNSPSNSNNDGNGNSDSNNILGSVL